MKQDIRLLLTPEGFVRETVYTEAMPIDDGIMMQLVSQKRTEIRNIGTMKGGDAGPMSVLVWSTPDNNGMTNYAITMRLTKLYINAGIKLLEKDKVVPLFIRQPTEPTYEFQWIPPNNMTLLFVVSLIQNHVGYYVDPKSCFLSACTKQDKKLTHYHLPIANLFDTNAICMGEFGTGPAETMMDGVDLAYNQFKIAPYNNHLTDNSLLTMAEEMFRFRPTKDGFEQLSPPANWINYCQKVATSTLDSLILA